MSSSQMPADRVALAAAVVLADDQLLGDVDEPAGEVAGVGGAQGGVDEALTGAGRGDEVLEHRQALTEVGLDRPGDHVASGVGHQAAHAGDLADLHHVPAGARAHHHVDGVELLLLEDLLHRGADLVGGGRPDLHFLLAPLAVGDDALAELAARPSRLPSRAGRGSPLLGLRRLHVVDRDRETRPGRELEAEVLDAVEAARPRPPSGSRGSSPRRALAVGESSTISPMSFFFTTRLTNSKSAGQRLVEEQAAVAWSRCSARSPSACAARNSIWACRSSSPLS